MIFDHNNVLNEPEIVICNEPELFTLMILWVSAGRLIDNPQAIKKTQMSTVSMNELSAGILAPTIKFFFDYLVSFHASDMDHSRHILRQGLIIRFKSTNITLIQGFDNIWQRIVTL